MKSSNRLALLKYRAAMLGIVPVFAGFIPASESEVREEIDLATRNEVSDSILDDENEGWESELPFGRAKVANEAETAILLSRNDRRQLAQDVYNAQLAKRLSFAIVLRPNTEQELNEYRELSGFAHV